MPYDPYAIVNPWWQRQQQQQQQPVQFAAPPPPEQPKQWWQGLPPPKNLSGQSANRPDDTGQPANSPKQPSLYDMMLNLGRMNRPQYDQAVKGTGPAAQVSPWAWLSSLYGGGPGGGR